MGSSSGSESIDPGNGSWRGWIVDRSTALVNGAGCSRQETRFAKRSHEIVARRIGQHGPGRTDRAPARIIRLRGLDCLERGQERKAQEHVHEVPDVRRVGGRYHRRAARARYRERCSPPRRSCRRPRPSSIAAGAARGRPGYRAAARVPAARPYAPPAALSLTPATRPGKAERAGDHLGTHAHAAELRDVIQVKTQARVPDGVDQAGVERQHGSSATSLKKKGGTPDSARRQRPAHGASARQRR